MNAERRGLFSEKKKEKGKKKKEKEKGPRSSQKHDDCLELSRG
jgi:hypothetical protein